MSATDPTPLADYQSWLRRRGAGDGSIDQYSFHVGKHLAGDDLFDRLTDKKLSPKYRRLLKASLASYARFTKDDGLVESLAELKLPAAVRKTAQTPLSETAWRNLRAAIDSSKRIKDPVRAVLGIMTCRGLRSGDVLRLRQNEIGSAIKKGVLSFEAKGERRLEFGLGPGWQKYLELLADESWHRGERVLDLVAPRAKPAKRAKSASAAVGRALQKVATGVDLDGYDLDDLHPHSLRRTMASLMYEKLGRDPMKLMQFFQWAQIGTAMGYVDHARREELDALADELFED